MILGRTSIFTLALVVALPGTLLAQAAVTSAPGPKRETQAQLRKDAKVSLSDATATAQAAVPNGRILSHEIEREKGKLIYSFDIKTTGKSGIDEVNVDAMTGSVIEKVHESPAAEAKEAAADRKAAKPPVKKP